MKSKRFLIASLTAGLLMVVMTASAHGQPNPALANRGAIDGLNTNQYQPLERVLNPDGTLNLEDGFTGSLDPTGWRMVTGPNGEPRFVRTSTPGAGSAGASAMFAPGDENWADGFSVLASSFITAIAIDGSDMYVGGEFTSIGGINANRVAKWNGSSWSALGSGVDDRVQAIAVDGSDVYFGGRFLTAGGISVNRIAKWNGSTWSALGTGVNEQVTTIAISSSNVYAGGSFTQAGGVSANYIAMWNGSNWASLGSGVSAAYNTIVQAITIDGSDVYVGGFFSTAGGVAAGSIAKWNGSTWSALGTGLNHQVNAIAINGSDIYAGGSFTAAGGTTVNRIAKWNGSSWSALGSGFENTVNDIAIFEGDVYAVGGFLTAGGISANRIARWDGANWYALESGLNNRTDVVTHNGSEIFVCGVFTKAGDVATGYMAKWDGDSWSAIGNGLQYYVHAIAIDGSDVYVGGAFLYAGGIPVNRIAKWNGSDWDSLGSGMDGQVHAVAVSGGNVYAGGEFTTAGGTPANYIARWDGFSWSPLGSGLDNAVREITADGSDIYVGGLFTSAGGVSANHIAKWNGSSWETLGSGVNSTVVAIVIYGGNVYVGGGFTQAGGGVAYRIAKWDGANWTPLGGGFDGVVQSIAICAGDLFAGGTFTTAGGQSANHIARWDGSSWHAMGSGTDGTVYTVATSGVDIYVGGQFSTAGGASANNLARWSGNNWYTLGSGSDGRIEVIAGGGSNLFAGGAFQYAGEKPANFFSFWNKPAGSSLTFTVIDTDDSGPGSLRQAIIDANNNSVTDVIDFNIPGIGPHNIQPSSVLPPITDPVIIDGLSQSGAHPNTNPFGQAINATLMIEVDGSIASTGGTDSHGFEVQAGNSTVSGLVINGFGGGAGIYLSNAGGNVVEGNFIGTNVQGTAVVGNWIGIIVDNTSGNRIGNTGPSGRNLISGHEDGIFITGTSASNNSIVGNYIGTDAQGTAALPNTQRGISISLAPGNIVGGTTAGAGNLISGNNEGVYIYGTDAVGNQIQGNYIGTDHTGTTALPNTQFGIHLYNAPNNYIGGTETGSANVILGHGNSGIMIEHGGNTTVQGNLIGVSADGSSDLGGNGKGIQIAYSDSNLIGGTDPSARNIISGNNIYNIAIVGNGAFGNLVQGNYIGTDISGTIALNNSVHPTNNSGIYIYADNNTVGGLEPGAGNLISGNSQDGIHIVGSRNKVQGNLIGTDFNGSTALGNYNGVNINHVDSDSNLVGGTDIAARNIISGNTLIGVYIGDETTYNIVHGNFIGIARDGVTALGNGNHGIRIHKASENTIGGTTSSARNIISSNGNADVYLGGSKTDSNIVQGNYIGTDSTGTISLSLESSSHGILIDKGFVSNPTDSVRSNIIGGTAPGSGNLIAGHLGYEIHITSPYVIGTQIQGNIIGTDITGSTALALWPDATGHNIQIGESSGNVIGSTDPNGRNLISGSPQYGIVIQGAGATNNRILGNYIGTDLSGENPLPNRLSGIRIKDAPYNTIGGTEAGAGNVISGHSTTSGITVEGGATDGIRIQGNNIGTNPNGLSAIPNNYGIQVSGAPNTLVGGTDVGAGNLISGNQNFGIWVNGASDNCTIQGNYIGTNPSGTGALQNGRGIVISNYSTGTTIGGTTPQARNIISGNREIGIQQQSASGTIIQGNFIGTDVSGSSPLGNNSDGIQLFNASDNNLIGGLTASAGNVIAFNQGYGINLIDGVGNGIFGNSIHSNSELGIDLAGDGVTPNDLNDTDSSPNNFQNYPDLISAIYSGGNITIEGDLNSTSSTTFRVEFFASESPDPSGYGEGQTFLGFADITTDGSGNASFSESFSATGSEGDYITATATDPSENTSEFSAAITASTITTIYVINTADTGPGSLRQAILDANASPGLDLIAFNIPGTGTWTITPASWLPEITDPVVIDGTTQPGFAGTPVIQLNCINSTGLIISAGNSTVRGLVINRYSNYGIELRINGGNVIEGNYLGVDLTGTTALPREEDGYYTRAGVRTQTGSDGNRIGGTSPDARNLISGNILDGILLNSNGNVVQGNYIGTDVTGSTLIEYHSTGISIVGSNNTIGGTGPGAGNLISGGQQTGIRVGGVSSADNVIQGNLIGVDATGQSTLGNQMRGILVSEGTGTVIGGTTPEARNIISGHTQWGVGVNSTNSTNTIIHGNYIGLDIDGIDAVPNDRGVRISDTQNNVVGGTEPGAGNVISGNTKHGVVIERGNQNTTQNRVEGNLIGTDPTGTVAIPNGWYGVYVHNARESTIGGADPNARNIISGNTLSQVRIEGDLARQNRIANNYIGTDSTGTSALVPDNTAIGVHILDALSNWVGGSTDTEGNLISGNGTGILVEGITSTTNWIWGNYIGTNADASGSVSNYANGVVLLEASLTQIGGTLAERRNIISGNVEDGIYITGSNARDNLIRYNYIGTDLDGDAAIPNGLAGIRLDQAPSNIIGGVLTETGNLISGNTKEGIVLSNADSTEISGNLIGTDSTGTAILGNGAYGIDISFASDHAAVGGTEESQRNIISGNKYGLRIYGSTKTKVIGNYIGLDISGTSVLGNQYDGIYITGSPDNAIGGLSPGNRNVITGNGVSQITIREVGSSGNTVQNNLINTDYTGLVRLSDYSGMRIMKAPNNTVGGLEPGSRNVICNGIDIIQSDATGNIVQGNFIGPDITGLADFNLPAGGRAGVVIDVGASGNIVGSTDPRGRNVISGNNQTGVVIRGGAYSNQIIGNYIGVDSTGTAPLPNKGIGVWIGGDVYDNYIGGTSAGAGNIIAFNEGVSGVHVYGKRNAILRNTIHSNGGIGIDLAGNTGTNLGVTLNDTGDADNSDGNDLQNYPVLSSAYYGSGSITIEGVLNSLANTSFRLEFFANIEADPSGYGEGQTYLGYADVITDGLGDASFSETLPATGTEGDYITATATDPVNNTSEFSQALTTSIPAQPPTIALYQPTGTQSGEVIISYVITDPNDDVVSLQAEYSTDEGINWQLASVTGTTTDIGPGDYEGSIIWNSASDLPDQDIRSIWFQITPSDVVSGTGTADVTLIDVDNLAPQTIGAEGTSGVSIFNYWFDEPVDEVNGSNPQKFTLSGGYSIDDITVNDGWTTAEPIPSPRYRGPVAGVIDGKLYVVGGGILTERPTGRTEVYDPSLDSWTTLSPMPTPRRNAAAGVIDGKLYVAGGFDGGTTYYNTLEVYDPSTDTWFTKAPMDSARYSSAAGVIEGKLYVVGGTGADFPTAWRTTILEVYDPSTDTWTTKSPMTMARHSFVAGVIGGKLYVKGGGTVLAGSLEVYDPQTNSWATKADPVRQGALPFGGAIGDKMYVVGGVGAIPENTTLEIYDSVTDSWSIGTSMPTLRGEGCSGVINGKLYTVGGSSGGDIYFDEVEIYDPQHFFEATLTGGQALNGDPIDITATNIPDYFGNTAPSLNTTFIPEPPPVPPTSPPVIAVYQPTGTQSRDVTIPYMISDEQYDPVDLLVEFSPDSGISWATATVDGITSGIEQSQYDGQLLWKSATDLPDQDNSNILFRITPSDVEVGVSDTTHIDVDNQAPVWMLTEGVVGSSELRFWFNEPVAEKSMADLTSIALTGNLSASAVIAHDSWSSAASMLSGRQGSVAGVIDGKLYVAGGSPDGNRLEVYNPESGIWSVMASMNESRYLASAGVIDGLLYVAGGEPVGGQVTNTLEVYDPATNSWEYRAPMLLGRSLTPSVVMNGKLYVIGWPGQGDTQVYDPATDSWDTIAPLPDVQMLSVAGVIDGRLYVAGGWSGSGDVPLLRIYDSTTDSWTNGPSMAEGKEAASGGVIGGKFYVIGGTGSEGTMGTVEVYDPILNNWTTRTSMLTPRHATASGVIDGLLYVAGGDDGVTGTTSLLEIYNPQDYFIATLSDGQTLPHNEVTLSAADIPDYYSNSAGLFQSKFEPAASLIYVTNTNDSGAGSLRQAILDANIEPGKDVIKFNIPGLGPHTIQPAAALPTITDTLVIDGYSQPGSSPNTNGPTEGTNAILKIVIDGSNAGQLIRGLDFTSGGNSLKGIVICNFTSDAIHFETGGYNIVEGCFIGTDATGTQVAGSNYGVRIMDSSGNRVGGTTTRARNLISGNNSGISISGVTTSNNIVQGNLIGTDASGKNDLGNVGDAIQLAGCFENTIGGSTQAARNILSGNGTGVRLNGPPESPARRNKIIGNFIGTDVTGTTRLQNTYSGVSFGVASENTLGGSNEGERNIISGNGQGVTLGIDATGNQIYGNYIGPDITGTQALGNGKGIYVHGSNNFIGAAAEGFGNLISGNGDGILFYTLDTWGPCTGNIIKGNVIGADANGEPMGNNFGICFRGTGHPSGNYVGGLEPDAGNLIVFNGASGVELETGLTNAVVGNTIHSNGRLGINLASETGTPVATPNDYPDVDGYQNYPDLSSASYGPGSITVEGSLTSTPNSTFSVELFANSGLNSFGYAEGETHLGSFEVSTDDAGYVDFTETLEVPNGSGDYITATATAADSSTSEFSIATQTSVLEVTNTNDSGPGSLRELIETANSGNLGTITFNIPDTDPGYDDVTDTWKIQPMTPLPEITAPVTIDGYTQPGASANTNPIGDGSNALLKIVLSGANIDTTIAALYISGGKSIVRGLVINDWHASGIIIGGTGENIVEGCYIGVDATGMIVRQNTGHGIKLGNSPSNVIGGKEPSARNVVGGNLGSGIRINNTGAAGNLVQGNYLGINAAGTAAITNQGHGVTIWSASNNVIGGDSAEKRNIISGNHWSGVGVYGINATGNLIKGNILGLNAAGNAAIPNDNRGVVLHNAPANTIGGSSPGSGNVISGNLKQGIIVSDSTATDNLIQGNLIGTDATGTIAIGNQEQGIYITNASYNTIGGHKGTERNIISGNVGDQVEISGQASIHNIIAGNFIGTDVTGTSVLGNGTSAGIRLDDCIENLIGGSEKGARNVISGNSLGIVIQGPIESPAPRSNWVSGNYIGTDVSGTEDLGNIGSGLFISAAHENIIGGLIPAEANLISGNDDSGIILIDDSSQNKILGNLIGTDITGTRAIPNRIGVDLAGAIDNQIGGVEAGAGNLISGNAENGIGMLNASTTGNIIQGNNIGADISGLKPMGNGISGIGMGVPAASGNLIGGDTPEAGNLIAFNGHDGITILEGTRNKIFFNVIHSNKDLGIDLNGDWITENDADDTDDGANGLLNYPELTSVLYSADSITIEGILTSTTENDYYLQFFANQQAEESEHGQGFVYIGGDTLNSGSTGSITFTSTFPATGAEGVYFSATATDTAGNTSEFSPQSSTPVFVVNNASDSGDGSLRWAIEQANLREGTDTVVFEIPETDPGFNSDSGVYTIALLSALPELSTAIVLDGSSQPGFNGDPIIALDGTDIADEVDGLRLTGGNCVVRSLIIGNFDGHGIHILGDGSGLGENLIAGCYIGVDSTGAQKSPNSGSGVRIINSPDNLIGGRTILAANIISGNAQHGVHISGSAAVRNQLYGNFIGSNPSADTGIENGGNGVLFSDEGDGEPSDSSVGGEEDEEGNLIAYNDGHGVAIYAGTGNRINSNFIHTNGGRGISLTASGNPTPDDEGDVDTGPNGLQNSPVLTFAQSYPYYIEGTLSSLASKEYRIEFFLNLDDDPQDPDGRSEGEIYLGSVSTTTTETGEASFSGSFEGPLSNSLFITATATDPEGNTSEFSIPISTTVTSKSFGDHYVLNTSYSGIPLHWEGGISDFVISESIPEYARQAIADGFKAWDELGQLNYTYKGMTNSTQWGGAVDGINNNTWITEGWEEATGTDASISALTRVRYNAITGVMTDVDIAFNAEHHQWSADQQPGTMDVASVSTHEAGHFSGLGDIYDPDDPGYLPAMGSGNSEQTMYGLILANETKKRTLNFGDRAGIEAIYGFLVKTGLDLVLVFDGSESYTTTYEAFEDARRSSIELIDKLRVGDRISAVQLPSITIFPLTEITSDPQWRETLKEAILAMTPAGGTGVALGTGLEAAQDQLQTAFDESRQTQAIILFTAGEENLTPTAREVTESSIVPTGTEVYTIGMAGSDGVALLSELADATNGEYYLAMDASDIPDKVDRIWEHLLGWQMLYQEMNSTEDLVGIPYPGVMWEGGLGIRWQGELGIRWQGETGIRWQGETGIRWQGGWGIRWQGETGIRWQGETGIRWQGELGIRWQGETGIRWQGETGIRWQGVMIDANTTDTEIGIRWQGSDLDLTLQDPDGNWITPEVAAVTDSIDYVSGDTYEYYRIHNPKPGVWAVWVYGKDLPAEPEPYTIYVAVHTDLTMDVEFDGDLYQAGEAVLITTRLQSGGESQGGIDLTGGAPITDATVYALIQVPQSLYMRAINLDYKGNGEYSAVYAPPTDTLGTYRFWVVAERSDPEGDGRGFFRTSEHSIHVTEAHSGEIVTIKNVIYELPDGAFKVPANDRRSSFSDKLDEVQEMIDDGNIQDAIDKLVHDIRTKMDGSFGGQPKNDWIITAEAQATVYPLVTGLIESLDQENGSAGKPEITLEDEEQQPEEFSVSQNFPNPFNLETQIRYTLPDARRVTLRIYDIRGRLVRMLLDEEQIAGRHTVRWDGRDSDGFVVSSGIYIYLLKAGDDVVSKKMTIIK